LLKLQAILKTKEAIWLLLGFWSVLATVLLLRWLPVVSGEYSVNSKSIWLWGGAYVLCAAAGLYTHYFFPAVLLTHNIYILLKLIQTLPKPLTINNLP